MPPFWSAINLSRSPFRRSTTSCSDGNATDVAVPAAPEDDTAELALPSEQEVVDRLKGDLDKFIADQKGGIIKTGSAEDIRDAFEDTYVETYQNELEVVEQRTLNPWVQGSSPCLPIP